MVEPIPISSALFVYSLVPCIFFFFYAIGGSVLLDLYDNGICPDVVKYFLLASVILCYFYLIFYFSVILRPLPLCKSFRKKWVKILIYSLLNMLFLAYLGAGIALALADASNQGNFSDCRHHTYYNMCIVSVVLFFFYFIHQLLIVMISSLRICLFCCFSTTEEEKLQSSLEIQMALERENLRQAEDEWIDWEALRADSADKEFEQIEKEMKEMEKLEKREENLKKRREEILRLEEERQEEKESEEVQGSGGKSRRARNRRESIELIQPSARENFSLDDELSKFGAQDSKEETAFEMARRGRKEPTEEEKLLAPGAIQSPTSLKQLQELLAPISPHIDLSAILEKEREKIRAEDRMAKVEELRKERFAKNAAQLNEAEKAALKEVAIKRQVEIEQLRVEREMRRACQIPPRSARGPDNVFFSQGGDVLFQVGQGQDTEFGITAQPETFDSEAVQAAYSSAAVSLTGQKPAGLRGSSAPDLEEDSMLGNSNGEALDELSAGDLLLAGQESVDNLIESRAAENLPKSKKNSRSRENGEDTRDNQQEENGGNFNIAGDDPMLQPEEENPFNDQGEMKKKKKKKKRADEDFAGEIPPTEEFGSAGQFSLDEEFPASPPEQENLLAAEESFNIAGDEEEQTVKTKEKKKKKKKAEFEPETADFGESLMASEDPMTAAVLDDPLIGDSADPFIEDFSKTKRSATPELTVDTEAAAIFDDEQSIGDEKPKSPEKKKKGSSAIILDSDDKKDVDEEKPADQPKFSPSSSPGAIRSSLKSPLKPLRDTSRSVIFDLTENSSAAAPTIFQDSPIKEEKAEENSSNNPNEKTGEFHTEVEIEEEIPEEKSEEIVEKSTDSPAVEPTAAEENSKSGDFEL